MPRRGGDDGSIAIRLTAVTVDTGHFDGVPDVMGGGRPDDHGGYDPARDPVVTPLNAPNPAPHALAEGAIHHRHRCDPHLRRRAMVAAPA